MSNVTKRDLILDIVRSTGFTQNEIKQVIEGFFSLVGESLSEEKNIEIRGFGTFFTKSRKARAARNPKTGDQIQLNESLAPLFKFSSELKSLVDMSHQVETKEVESHAEFVHIKK